MWFETHSAMKSVPPVEAPALRAMAMESPETTPPKMMSMILSPRKGAKSKMLRNSEERATWGHREDDEAPADAAPAHECHGMFNASIPSEVSIWTPPSEVMPVEEDRDAR